MSTWFGDARATVLLHSVTTSVDALSGLPFDDASADGMDGDVRALLAEYWTQRARSERRVGRAFELMVPRLEAVSAAPEVLTLLRSAVDEERRHAGLCMQMAAYYTGTHPAPVPAIADVVLPSFGYDDPVMENAVLVAGMCCINESIACVWLEACLNVASTPLTIAANRLHLREEVRHAQLGWAHLASSAVPPTVARAVDELVPALIEANRPLWQEPHPTLPLEGIPEHGCPGRAAHHEVIEMALREVVLPGFAQVQRAQRN